MKVVTRFCEVTGYWLGLDALFYCLNRRRKRIVTFHHVLPDELYFAGIVNGVSCSETDFRMVLRRLARCYTFSLDLNDSKTVTLTFDDGYRSQYEVVFRCLREMGDVPAYLFVSGALVPEAEFRKGPLIIDLLTLWISCVPVGLYNLDFMGKTYQLDISDASRLRVWCDILWPLYCEDGEHYGGSLLDALSRQCYPIEGITKTLPKAYHELRLTGMTFEELEELKNRGWAIGSHGYHHFPMGYLSERQVRAEVRSGFEAVARWQTTSVYSYPFGGVDTIGDVAPGVVAEAGASCAVSNVHEPCVSDDRFRNARMALSADRYAFHFELSGFKYFLKYGRLLPRVRMW